jgi:hypothetical protein
VIQPGNKTLHTRAKEMGGAYSMQGRDQKIIATKLSSDNLNGRNNLGELVVSGRIILKWILSS